MIHTQSEEVDLFEHKFICHTSEAENPVSVKCRDIVTGHSIIESFSSFELYVKRIDVEKQGLNFLNRGVAVRNENEEFYHVEKVEYVDKEVYESYEFEENRRTIFDKLLSFLRIAEYYILEEREMFIHERFETLEEPVGKFISSTMTT